jgi:hypothetical protein
LQIGSSAALGSHTLLAMKFAAPRAFRQCGSPVWKAFGYHVEA